LAATREDIISEASPSNRFGAFLAICIALATVIGAILAARAAVYNDAANDADQEGLSSVIDLALTQSSVEAQRAQNLSALLQFAQYRRLAELISDQMKQLDSSSEKYISLRYLKGQPVQPTGCEIKAVAFFKGLSDNDE
jgi:hypothetical protein